MVDSIEAKSPHKGLTDADCRNAKPGRTPDGRITTKSYKMADSLGLYLLVKPTGAKLWRLKYRFAGREKTFSIGPYMKAHNNRVEVGLREARDKRDEKRRLLRDGVDPGERKRVEKIEAKAKAGKTFEKVALEWQDKHRGTWSSVHRDRVEKFLRMELYPKIGQRPIDAITAPELLAAIEAIEQRGALETAKKTRQYASAVFDYAQRTRGTIGNPAAALRGAMKRRESQRYRFLSRAELGPFLAKLQAYSNRQTSIALRLHLMTAVRPGELRGARWNEFDLSAKAGAIWRVPAERMKGRAEHVVPLSKQAVKLLRELAGLVGSEPGSLLFPSLGSRTVPISENTLTFAIRRLGFAAASHGARHTFSTIANEDHLARPDVIEAALAHKQPGVRGIYNTAEYLADRRALLQQWADLLDKFERSAEKPEEPVAQIKRVYGPYAKRRAADVTVREG